MIPVFRSLSEWMVFRSELVVGHSLGFVPTMGGLHEGHSSLVRRSLAENELTAASIFLNRTQFNNASDYETYPANFEQDLALLEDLGVDVVFAPDFEAMYPDTYLFKVSERQDSLSMEGAQRPGHFDGVLTVVLKLLNLSGAQRAYFGEKDYQQLRLVKGMVEAFFLPIEIVACETARADDGLALSSRNRRLSEAGRKKAAVFPLILTTVSTPEEATSELREAGFEVEYVVDEGGRRFGAVNLEGVRLIDNWPLGVLKKLKGSLR